MLIHQQSTAMLSPEDVGRLKTARRLSIISCIIFSCLCLGTGWLLFITLSDPHFRPSDGYYVAGFFAFIMVLAGVVSNRIRRRAQTLSKCLDSGLKLVMLTHCTHITNAGSAKIPVYFIHLVNGDVLEIKLVDKKALINCQSVLHFSPDDLLEIHCCKPENILLQIGRK